MKGWPLEKHQVWQRWLYQYFSSTSFLVLKIIDFSSCVLYTVTYIFSWVLFSSLFLSRRCKTKILKSPPAAASDYYYSKIYFLHCVSVLSLIVSCPVFSLLNAWIFQKLGALYGYSVGWVLLQTMLSVSQYRFPTAA